MIQDFAFDCSSYEEYCSIWDDNHPAELVMDEQMPQQRTVKITYPDGKVAEVSTCAITIGQLMDAKDAGAEIDCQ